ncbi:MAG: GMP synthase [glutamine-hydrolyzing] [Candidatus Roseilinea sp.]|nr:MAG: GMP synthase [glutamine-hydrolyzing] [Candidatus Roseilinea sp.]
MTDAIAVLDFGSQYSQLIARRVREAHVYCELFPWDAPREQVMALQPRGFILSGGPNSVYDAGAPALPGYVLESGRPVLGICYGMQLLAHALGGRVAASARREYGEARLEIEDCELWPAAITHLRAPITVWMSHGDRIESLPPGFQIIARTANSPIAGMADRARRLYAIQFHPEVNHTQHGREIIAHFVHAICGCRASWTPANIIEESVQKIRAQVGRRPVICGLSGGVDSAVAAALVHKAVGDQLTCVFVNTGLLRKGEPEQVVETFEREQGMRLIAVDASEEFLEVLSGVTDPEDKRRRIGEKFIRVFESVVREQGLGVRDQGSGAGGQGSGIRVQGSGIRGQELEVRSQGQGPRGREWESGVESGAKRADGRPLLCQGTLYPDVIESRGPERQAAAKIKTHHNVGGLPKDMQFELLEPLRYLFKDEVRAIGAALGLPDAIVWRQPFPGPGLAVRVLGEVTWERLERLRAADAILQEELRRADLTRATSQAFAVLLPVRTVGVMGDGRTYSEVIAIRAVTTDDFMTADWARIPFDVLARISNRIVNEVPGVNRVAYDITTKPPATIEWE